MQDIALMSDINAEAGFNASIIAHPEFLAQFDYVRPGYFYDLFNASVLWAMQQLYKEGIEVFDALNISNMINTNRAVRKKVDEYNVKDIQEFIQMSQYAARHTVDEVRLMANSIVTMAFKRDLYRLAGQFQTTCFDADADLTKINALVNDKINDLTEKYITSNQIELFGEKIDELWEELVSRRTKDGIYGLPSKFPLLNEYCTYEPGELVLLSARMKRGKSAFFLNEALHKIRNGVPTLYIDTEMGDRLFMERMLASLTGIEVKRIKMGRYSVEEEGTIRKAIEWVKKQPFVHMYLPQTTDEEIYAINKILKYKMGLQFTIYDYIKSNTASTGENYNLLGQKVDFLKNKVAGELNLAVLAGAQLGRENRVADSDKIERYVSTSIFWREKTAEEMERDGEACGNFCMNVALNRNGEQMAEEEYIDMMFDGNRMRIVQAEQHKSYDTPFKEGE